MNKQHEKSLRLILGVGQDPSVKFSPELIGLVERCEERSTRFFGAFQEMSITELTLLISMMSDDECLVKDGAVKESAPPVDYSKLSKGDLIKECSKRKLNIRGNESNADLAAILAADDKE